MSTFQGYVVRGLPLAQAEEETGTTEPGAEEHNPILPETDELLWGSIAFFIVFAAIAFWAWPRIRKLLAERTEKIQGELEKAESTRHEADRILEEYREQIARARDEAGRIIEEARRTAEQLRKDLQARAEQEAQSTVARAQEEIRAERDRVVQELRAQVGALSIQLAERVVGASLDQKRHQELIDEYIEELAGSGSGGGS
ncbi:MAG: F0F1 ATP synthase subunit B [Actinobacteria bacterium]|nr:F0F1 ATP synthase subunit B [Actinomycetota bacterium]